MTDTTQASSSPQAPPPTPDAAAPAVPMTAAAGEGATTVRTTEDLTPLGEALRRATAGRYGPVRELTRSTLPAELVVRDPAMSMEEARDWTVNTLRSLLDLGLGGTGFPTSVGGLDDVGRSCVDFEMTAHGDLSVTVKSGVHFGLY